MWRVNADNRHGNRIKIKQVNRCSAYTVWLCTNAQICKCAIIANAIIIMKLEIALRSNTCSAHSAHNIVVESNVL